MNKISLEDYQNEVRSIAHKVMLEVAMEDGFYDECSDRLHETLNSNYWITSEQYIDDIIRYTKNEDYCERNLGVEQFKGKSYAEIGAIIAYWSMYGDIMERMTEDKFNALSDSIGKDDDDDE